MFYRGLHCPICKTLLKDLEAKLQKFEKRGAERSQSRLIREKGPRPPKRIGAFQTSGSPMVSISTSRARGASMGRLGGQTSAGVDEPALFSEPALYLIVSGIWIPPSRRPSEERV